MAKFASLMETIAIPAYFIVGAITFFGVIKVTGAPPGGVLSHFGVLGAAAAIVAASTYGGLSPVLFALGWFSIFAIPMAILGTVRRRSRWYAIPVAIAFPLASYYGDMAAESVLFWLGGVSRFDVSAYWAMSAAIFLTAVGQFPIWVRSFWRWTNMPPSPGIPQRSIDGSMSAPNGPYEKMSPEAKGRVLREVARSLGPQLDEQPETDVNPEK